MAIFGELLLVVVLLGVVSSRLRRLRAWLVLDPAELAGWVRRAGEDGGARLAVTLAPAREEETPRGVYARLAAALIEPDPQRRAAGCNEALLELEAGLVLSVDETGGLLRLLILGTMLILAWAVTQGELEVNAAVGVLALGGGAVLVMLSSTRESRVLAATWREGIDRWVAQGLRRWGEAQARKVDGRRRTV